VKMKDTNLQSSLADLWYQEHQSWACSISPLLFFNAILNRPKNGFGIVLNLTKWWIRRFHLLLMGRRDITKLIEDHEFCRRCPLADRPNIWAHFKARCAGQKCLLKYLDGLGNGDESTPIWNYLLFMYYVLVGIP
jgi:hypothetical protein